MHIRRLRVEHLALAADERVHGAAHDAVFHHAGLALGAADAGRDLPRLPLEHLAGQERIGDQGAAHRDRVDAGVGEKLLHRVGHIERADGHDRGFDVLFDLRGEVAVVHILLEGAGMHEHGGELLLLAAGGDVDEIDLPVEHFGDFNALRQIIAVLEVFGAGYADVDRHLPADGGANLFDDEQTEAHTVFQRAAPSVGTVVRDGAYELVDEPAVAAVQHDHIEAAVLRVLRGLGVFVRDPFNLLLGHLLHGVAPGVHVAGRAEGVFAADELRRAQRAAVVKLHLGHGPAGVDGVGQRREIRKRGRVVHAHLLRVAAARVEIDDHVADGHDRRAAEGAELVVFDVFL